MQEPRMIVLALVAQGRDYGLAMEEFVERSRMRLWAKIGASTIYKALKELEADKCLTSRRGEAKRGPGKKVFKLTAKGARELEALVGEALASQESVYSDRVAGLIFALSLPRAKARAKVDGAVKGMDMALEGIREERMRQAGDELASIVLDYYATIYKAEQKAMKAVRERLLK